MKLKLLYPAKPINYKGELSAHINQHFGENVIPLYKELGLKGHNGLDLGAIDGSPVYAAHDGIVTFTGEDGSGGLGVVIRTKDMFEYNGGNFLMKSIYWHLLPNSFKVKPGDEVRAGQVIGLADNTGMSTGSHLHFGLKPIYQGEKDWQFYNADQNNGYHGAIDSEPYFIGYANQSFYFLKDLKYRDKSDDIKELQRILKGYGYFQHEPTGHYGDITAKAVLVFQLLNKVSSIAELYFLRGRSFGPKSRKKLNELLK